jgi:hypothetical protein
MQRETLTLLRCHLHQLQLISIVMCKTRTSLITLVNVNLTRVKNSKFKSASELLILNLNIFNHLRQCSLRLITSRTDWLSVRTWSRDSTRWIFKCLCISSTSLLTHLKSITNLNNQTMTQIILSSTQRLFLVSRNFKVFSKFTIGVLFQPKDTLIIQTTLEMLSQWMGIE